jgi:signal transduction histidine kinase/ActR/RegA family two-component response regulator
MTSRRWRLSSATLAMLVAVSAVAVVATVIVRSQVDHQSRNALEQRSSELSLTLSGGLAEVRSALGVLSNIRVESPGTTTLFEDASRPLLTQTVKYVGLMQRDGDSFDVIASVGDGATPGARLSGDRATLATRAIAATDFVSAVLHDSSAPRLAFAVASVDRSRVVMRESAITPTVPVTSLRGQPFSDIDAAVYASPKADPANLVLATSATTPLTGDTTETTINVGTDKWLIVSASRSSLVGALSDRAPTATLVAGLVLALLLAAVVETLARRRRYALGLVEARTVELRQTVDEQTRLEQEARRASAEAIAANQSKNEFLSRMSHELRTPLNAVLGFSQLLELEDLSETQRESVEQIRKGGRHLLDLINEVLDLTRLESGSFSLSPEPVLAADVLTEALELMQPLAAAQRINLVGDPTRSCNRYAFADRQRLKQILLNLLSNAVKYNRVGGTVAVACSVNANRLSITVTDTGAGIRAEDIERLFAPFERLGAEHSDVEGTGIGLALSRRLAEAMGGSLEVESAVTRGSTFAVNLPLVEGPVERYERLDAASDDAATGEVAGNTVVHIEDNLSNLRLVEQVIARQGGTELVVAMQGRLGLELVRQHRPAAVLLDLHLPDIDGEDVLRALRDDPETASIPVVILSADATPGQVQRLLAAGARAYLTKPLEVRQLLEILDDIVGDRG